MKKFALVKNDNNAILAVKDFPEDFSPASLKHKFGSGFAVRIIPYEIDADLTFDPETQKQTQETSVLSTKVRIVKSVVSLSADELAKIADQKNRESKIISVGQKAAILRQWADDAANVTVTQANAVAVLGQTVERLSTFFANFADLIEGQGLDQ